MRQIRWAIEAADQLEHVFEQILQTNPAAARNTAQIVIDRVELLATFPGLGRRSEVPGTHELVSTPYVVVDRFNEEIVEILRIWHGAQDWK